MKKVLVIDDDAMMQRMAAFMLQKLGCEGVTAGSGTEGLAQMRDTLPDLTIIDVEMPEMDGFAVLRAIRADEALRDASVCMMTGTLTDPVRDQAIALRCVGCLIKPIRAEALQKLLG
ncbi:MAG: response regulator [Oscillospiraceae bacterium]|nr:response regulator [Oscillospiraceae bacterium]